MASRKKIVYPLILAATLVVGVVLAFSIWRATPQTAEDFLNSGRKYYQERKYPEATVQLMNALQKDPDIQRLLQ